ncbi:MAG: (2Fe-2S)-binding protein [Acidobacteria bacterium]|nr:(2Fe-2S)-binding protein [Acidobacteriota bacterium]
MKLNVNGKLREVDAGEHTTLLSVLRHQLDLTGAKPGCGEGACGSCTVLVAGKPVRSCITLASTIGNKPVITIEGLARNGRLHKVQQAFLDGGAFQCGYCTPGMILEAVALLEERPSPTDGDVRRGMDGHICRCGTYPRIVDAVLVAAKGGRRG